MLQVSCPSCGRTLNVRDDLAGTRVRCPGCQTVLQVPASGTAAPAMAPVAPAARPAPPPASDNPFDFGGGVTSPAAGPRAAFADLEDPSPERHAQRRRAQRAAAAMYRAVVALIAIPLVCLVLSLAILGAAGAPGGAVVILLFIDFGILAALLVLPVTFLCIGGRCLERRTSPGLAITGAVFALLAGTGMGLVGVFSALSVVAGNWGGLIAGPLYLLGAAANIYAGVVALTAATHPDAREAFGYR